jgi:hypothetical protein
MLPETATSAAYAPDTLADAAAAAAVGAADYTDSSSEVVAESTVLSTDKKPDLLPPGQKEIILHLGFKPDSQLDYGGRHITIATFKGMRNSSKTGSYKAMTTSRLARWINITSKCDRNLVSLTSRSWRLNTTTCSNKKATSCSCIGHYNKTKDLMECGEYPWNPP